MPFLVPLGSQVGDVTEAGERLDIVRRVKDNLNILGKEARIEATFKIDFIDIKIIADTHYQFADFDGSRMDAPLPLLRRLIAPSRNRLNWARSRENQIIVVELIDEVAYGPRDSTFMEMSEKAKITCKYIFLHDRYLAAFALLVGRGITFLFREGRFYVRFPGVTSKSLFETTLAIQAITDLDEDDLKARTPFDADVSELYDDVV